MTLDVEAKNRTLILSLITASLTISQALIALRHNDLGKVDECMDEVLEKFATILAEVKND